MFNATANRASRPTRVTEVIYLSCVWLAALCCSATATDEPVDFSKQIGPIFEQNCARCHSPGNRKGEISLATFDDLKSNEYVIAGDLWTDPLGRLWLIFDQSMDMFDGRAGVWVTICKNPGASGRLLLVKHGNKVDAHKGRVQLSAWLSDDERVTWNGGLILDERKGISYLDGSQAADSMLYISYDRNRATDGEILMARFTEADVLAKQLVAPRSKLKMPISRPLGRKQNSGGK